MSRTKRELIEYVDCCMEHNIPMNRFTYIIYSVNKPSFIYDIIINAIVRINYFFKK